MNHLDPIEKRFKEGLEAYQDVAPSGGLYRRIERSLLKHRVARLFNKKRSFILLALLLGVVWTAYSILNQEQRHHLAVRHQSYIQHADKMQKYSSVSVLDSSAQAQTSIASKEKTSFVSTPLAKRVSNDPSSLVPKFEVPKPEATFEKLDQSQQEMVSSLFRGRQHLLIPFMLQSRSADQLFSPEDPLKIGVLRKNMPHRGLRIYSEVYAGVGMASSSLSVTDPAWNAHLDMHKNNERSLSTPVLGVDVKYFRHNYFLQSGLRHYTFTDYMVFQMDVLQIEDVETHMRIVENIFVDTIVSYIHTPIDSLPVYQKVLDTTLVTETVSHYIDSSYFAEDFRYTNTISYIEIPLMVGYQFQWQAWYLDVSAGVSYSRLLQQYYRYPDKDMTQLLDHTQQSSTLRKHLFAAQVSMGLGYQFSPQTSIFVRPSYHYHMQSIFGNDYPLRKKYQQMRFVAGLRFKM